MPDNWWSELGARPDAPGARRASFAQPSRRAQFDLDHFGPPSQRVPTAMPANRIAQDYAMSLPLRPRSDRPAHYGRHSADRLPQTTDYDRSVSDGRSRRSSRSTAIDSVFGAPLDRQAEPHRYGRRMSLSAAPSSYSYESAFPVAAPPNRPDLRGVSGSWPPALRLPPPVDTRLLGRSDYAPAARSTTSSSRHSRYSRSEDPRAARRGHERRSSQNPAFAPVQPPLGFADPFTPRTPPTSYLHGGSSVASGLTASYLDLPERRGPPMSRERERGRDTHMQRQSRMAPAAVPPYSTYDAAPTSSSRLRRMVGRTSLASAYERSSGGNGRDQVAELNIRMPGGTEVNIMERSESRKGSRHKGSEVVRNWWR